MKTLKPISLILTVSLILLSLFSCTDDTPAHVCEHNGVWHVEGNTHYLQCKDASCTADNGKPQRFAEGAHTDENGNMKCDTCGADMICTQHEDIDFDDKCDICGTSVATGAASIPLIEGMLSNFKFVIASDAASDVHRIINIDVIRQLSRQGVEVSSVTEGASSDSEQDIEILIGGVKNRGSKYYCDGRLLGENGYLIKIIDSKVVITAGSTEKLCEVLMDFAENVLGIKNEIFDVTMTQADCEYYKQTDFSISGISINGNDFSRNYKIVFDSSKKTHANGADIIRTAIYKTTGIYLEYSNDFTRDEAIILRFCENLTAENSFRIYAEGKNLIIESSYDNAFEKYTAQFLDEMIYAASGYKEFSGNIFNRDVSIVYYEDFGAVGDGVTDDFNAIYNAHVYANLGGQTVLGNPDATYYLCDSGAKSIPIKTNVDWRGAKFIIDDRKLSTISGSSTYEMATTNIFSVERDYGAVKITDRATLDKIIAEGVNPSTTKIDLKVEGWDGDLFIVIYNSSHKVFRRRGYSNYDGDSMNEVVVIDKDGNIRSDTPITFNYSYISSIYAYKYSESSAVTVENGTITTRASQTNVKGKSDTYFKRGILITRAYTTLRNIKHYITDEIPLYEQVDENGNVIKQGSIYSGFFNASTTTNVTLENCVLTGRRAYTKPTGGPDGTYDISATRVNKFVLKDCVQSNFWVTVDENHEIHAATEDTPGAILSMASVSVNGKSLRICWGIGGTNYCKNFEYINSTLSRLDAHAGLQTGKIVNSTVNFISLTGGGDFLIENSRWFAAGSSYTNNSIVYLRNDYGSTWNGTITLKNVSAYTYTNTTSYVIYHTYNNWYYGYTAHFPNLDIDNLDFYDIKTREALPAGYTINLTGTSISKTSKRHLQESHTPPYFAPIDSDKDGFIDEPIIDADLDGILDKGLDLDGDGKIGNTSIDYASSSKSTSGIKHTGSYVNLNIVIPPEYIKIVGNDGVGGNGGYVYLITDTSGGGISDGGYYDDVESLGGFYGDTKFYYSDTEYFLGSAHTDQTETTTFKFQ